MMALEPYNNLDTFPLKNLGRFILACIGKGIKEINLTGSNTEPLLYQHHIPLTNFLRLAISGVKLGIRTNGIQVMRQLDDWKCYDEASISITSFDEKLYKATMGSGEPPDLKQILAVSAGKEIKINTVLCPETVETGDIFRTLDKLADCGIKVVNLREPYGQPHIGSPLTDPVGERFGMPIYNWRGMDVTYWDVHYVKVESVNLYANGIVSDTYPVTKGHHPTGKVLGQEHWKKHDSVQKL